MVVTRFPVTQPVSTGCGGYQHQQTCDPSHLNISYLISSGEPQLLSSSDFLGEGEGEEGMRRNGEKCPLFGEYDVHRHVLIARDW